MKDPKGFELICGRLAVGLILSLLIALQQPRFVRCWFSFFLFLLFLLLLVIRIASHQSITVYLLVETPLC